MTNRTPSTTAVDPRAITEAAASLNPLPISVTRLAELVSVPEVDLERVVEVISYDPVLAGHVLARANAAPGAPRSTNVGQAAARLGSAAVLTVAIAHSAGPAMNAPLEIYGLSPGDLWRHSVAAAVSAEVIASVAAVRVPPQAVTAALLHDVGKMALARCIPVDTFGSVRQLATEHGLSLAEAEQRHLGISHPEAGRLVARAWRLPMSIQIGIVQHHAASQVADVVARTVGAADLLSDGVLERAAGIPPAEILVPEEFAETADPLVGPGRYGDLVELAAARFESVSEQYL